jgi:putative acyl-CoA dehydrogenase
MSPTQASGHKANNQSPPFPGHNAFRSDPLLKDIAADMPRGLRDRFRKVWASSWPPPKPRISPASPIAPCPNSGPMTVRQPYRPGGFPSQLACADAPGRVVGLQGSVWEGRREEKGFAHQARAIRFYLTAGLECGHLCPLTMTNASIAAIMASPRIEKSWAPQVVSRRYDSSHRPAMQKSGVTIGMGMTEKQGGTDVRANESVAVRAGEGVYRLSGHKWFLSAPMSDAFVMLAQTGIAGGTDTSI